MSWQCAFAAQKDSGVLGCIQSSMASRDREDSSPLLHSDEKPPGVLWSPQHKKDMDLLDTVQKAMMVIRGVEILSYEERLRDQELIILEKSSGRPPCDSSVPKRVYKKNEDICFSRTYCDKAKF
ncbi:hypothetical protein HGM15179_000542 [Zosterops borbonicus]|uniref:Uncharacterized protein n=1 Tax=Zosterops borbonicus TaxID=364589 RepID=A0A8K1LUA9_9PASS|nr:hypothetical protein HGM15179_000542 [Zosterops borbonicus]